MQNSSHHSDQKHEAFPFEITSRASMVEVVHSIQATRDEELVKKVIMHLITSFNIDFSFDVLCTLLTDTMKDAERREELVMNRVMKSCFDMEGKVPQRKMDQPNPPMVTKEDFPDWARVADKLNMALREVWEAEGVLTSYDNKHKKITVKDWV